MKLHNLLSDEVIFLQREVSSKDEAIAILIQRVVEKYSFETDSKILVDAVHQRELLGGTSFPTGLAVPHARLDNFDDIIITVLVPKVPFMDGGIKVRMVALILTAQTKPTLYLNCLSALVKLSQKDDIFNSLITAKSSKDFLKVLENQDISVKKPVLVGDLMSPPTITGSPKTSLKEILDIFYEHKFSYMPIVDNFQNLLGEIRLMDVIELGIPDYARQLTNLKFATSLEPFEKLLENESTFIASQIMKHPTVLLTPQTSLMEAALELSRNHERQLAVVEGKKLVGILSYMDLLYKILRV